MTLPPSFMRGSPYLQARKAPRTCTATTFGLARSASARARGALEVHQHDLGAFVEEPPGAGQAEAAGAAGDDTHPTVQ